MVSILEPSSRYVPNPVGYRFSVIIVTVIFIVDAVPIVVVYDGRGVDIGYATVVIFTNGAWIISICSSSSTFHSSKHTKTLLNFKISLDFILKQKKKQIE